MSEMGIKRRVDELIQEISGQTEAKPHVFMDDDGDYTIEIIHSRFRIGFCVYAGEDQSESWYLVSDKSLGWHQGFGDIINQKIVKWLLMFYEAHKNVQQKPIKITHY